MRGKTLVKGHTLLFEGQAFGSDGKLLPRYPSMGMAKCSCGMLSESLDSNAARKCWHKQHKAEVLRKMEVKNG